MVWILLFIVSSKCVILYLLELVYGLWRVLIVGGNVDCVLRSSFERLVIVYLLVVTKVSC